MIQELWNILSSPRHLIVFEAAARLGSFTRAAQEMNVQQPSVSATIAQLEASIGISLFRRSHRKVTLTGAGQRLFSDVSKALSEILTSARAVQRLGKSAHVTLNASSAFNYHWMMPRLRNLHARYPQIDLRLQNSDREPDIDAEGINLAIRRGDGNWPNCRAALIAPELIYPIASPRVMDAAVNLKTVANLLHEQLIHLEEPVRDRPGWAQWFAHHGINGGAPTSGLRLNDYALVLQAAIASEGFACGWHHIVGDMIAQGLLAARPGWGWKTGLGFYLVWSRSKPLIAHAQLVRDWILSVAAE